MDKECACMHPLMKILCVEVGVCIHVYLEHSSIAEICSSHAFYLIMLACVYVSVYILCARVYYESVYMRVHVSLIKFVSGWFIM